MTDEIREALANYAHEAWSGWMVYMFNKATLNQDGSITIPCEFYTRWCRQSETLYINLPEHEKESDRVEADKILAILRGETIID